MIKSPTADTYSVRLDGDIEYVSSDNITETQAQAFIDKLTPQGHLILLRMNISAWRKV